MTQLGSIAHAWSNDALSVDGLLPPVCGVILMLWLVPIFSKIGIDEFFCF